MSGWGDRGRRHRTGSRCTARERDVVRGDRLASPVADHERDLPAVIGAVQRDVQQDVLDGRTERLAGAVALKVAQHNVTLNNVLPGMYHTAFVHDQLTARAKQNGTSYEQEVEKMVDAFAIAAKRFGDSADVGAMVAMLCSQYAGYMVGQRIVMDGGATRSTF